MPNRGGAPNNRAMKTRVPRRTCSAAIVCFVSLTGYLALLGWDQHKTIGPDGYLHGPYETWQVEALCAVIAMAAAWAGWRGDGRAASVSATATITAAVSVDWATEPENDGLWSVGALMVLTVTYVGCRLFSLLGTWLRRQRAETVRRRHDSVP